MFFFSNLFKKIGLFSGVRVERTHFIFKGWRDESKRKRPNDDLGIGSVSYYVEELAAKREQPIFPEGLVLIIVHGKESPGVGTLEGANLEVLYEPDAVTIPEIKRYLEKIGLIVEEKLL